MHKLLLLSLLVAFNVGAVAQAANSGQATPGATSQSLQSGQAASGAPLGQSLEPAISSNGPVVSGFALHITSNDPVEAKIATEVWHQLLLLPYYSLFDDLEYTVQGRTVTLTGSVTNHHSETKQDAERAVKSIEGVENVINNIRVDPPLPYDDQVREQTYRALVRAGGLAQYFWQAAPSIHIVVLNKNVTLKGYVFSEGDKNLAGITARQVPSAFQVTNDLQVVKPK